MIERIRLRPAKKRLSGIPTGNSGEYFTMGELLRRGFDAQLADRNTAGYDMLVGAETDRSLHKVQVKSVRSAPWYVSLSDFQEEMLRQVTVYVLVGSIKADKSVQYFIARNSDLADHIHIPPAWRGKSTTKSGFMPLKAVTPFRDAWDTLRNL